MTKKGDSSLNPRPTTNHSHSQPTRARQPTNQPTRANQPGPTNHPSNHPTIQSLLLDELDDDDELEDEDDDLNDDDDELLLLDANRMTSSTTMNPKP